ncbi:MAG: S-methyl-5-thioribose-1-phosphate isomerase [Desulfobacterales bacterium]|nr:S-methyl-5-thioribose-1-phosphate isomerase [Desulfobacterales bacterium]
MTPRPIWIAQDGLTLQVIDQRRLPHERVVRDLNTVDEAVYAIKEMVVRGAPLIGVTAAWALAAAARRAPEAPLLEASAARLKAARPTAINLAWAVDRVLAAALACPSPGERALAARCEAEAITAAEVENCRRIGEQGVPLIEEIARANPGRPVNVLTHCNAGWLACVAYGTATAPIYTACERGLPVHVWVDETRPLNQGARLTAWELAAAGVPHTVIADNTGGHLMQQGRVDLVIVGTDRTTASGDVANKIGTYLKALAARDNGIPFYVALPSSSFDWSLCDGMGAVPIEERDPDEVRYITGWDGERSVRVRVCPEASPAANFAFDVTPARLVTGLITERGICRADPEGIRVKRLF